MIIEECPWTTWVYGLTYPGVNLFYVGVSVNPQERFRSHWAADGCCTSYQVIRHWKPIGRKFDHVLFGEYDDRVDALRVERALIDTVPCLVNDRFGGVLSRRTYPVTERDQVLLREALDQAGMIDWDEPIDCSPEYVDERYDELDLIEAP